MPQGPPQQGTAACCRGQREARDPRLHGWKGDVPFGESAVGAQPVGPVGSLQKVEEIVYQIGRTLHQYGEQQTQYRGRRMKRSCGICRCRTYEDKDDCIAQTVRPDGQKPCGK